LALVILERSGKRSGTQKRSGRSFIVFPIEKRMSYVADKKQLRFDKAPDLENAV
jgi:hypothetical protein